MTENTKPTRRTKRRYAHELYPEPDQRGILANDLPYLFAQGVGLDVLGTGWATEEGRARSGDRIMLMASARFEALIADALNQGMADADAWEWATGEASDETSSCFYDRAIANGIPINDIKPYPCGPERDTHPHYGEPDSRGNRMGVYVTGRESECPDCTEPIPALAEGEQA